MDVVTTDVRPFEMSFVEKSTSDLNLHSSELRNFRSEVDALNQGSKLQRYDFLATVGEGVEAPLKILVLSPHRNEVLRIVRLLAFGRVEVDQALGIGTFNHRTHHLHRTVDLPILFAERF